MDAETREATIRMIGTINYGPDLAGDDATVRGRVIRGQAERVLNALLNYESPDGRRWLLVHPDEMIRRDELEQVGWFGYEERDAPTDEMEDAGWHETGPDDWQDLDALDFETMEDGAPETFMNGRPHPWKARPVFRVRPAVEKENDQ